MPLAHICGLEQPAVRRDRPLDPLNLFPSVFFFIRLRPFCGGSCHGGAESLSHGWLWWPCFLHHRCDSLTDFVFDLLGQAHTLQRVLVRRWRRCRRSCLWLGYGKIHGAGCQTFLLNRGSTLASLSCYLAADASLGRRCFRHDDRCLRGDLNRLTLGPKCSAIDEVLLTILVGRARCRCLSPMLGP